MTLEELNSCNAETAKKEFLDCCGSVNWAKAMTEQRPYTDVPALQHIAEETWSKLAEQDWLQAFAAHPKIGEQKQSAKWSATEQAGMSTATGQTAATIRQMNTEYEDKFGWIFIVCATGKSADEMLHTLNTRLQNDPQTELPIAAAEQSKITHLRLEKLVKE